MINIRKRVLSSALAVLMSFPVGFARIFSTQAYTIGDKTSNELLFTQVENTKTVVKFTNGAEQTLTECPMQKKLRTVQRLKSSFI